MSERQRKSQHAKRKADVKRKNVAKQGEPWHVRKDREERQRSARRMDLTMGPMLSAAAAFSMLRNAR